MITSDRTRAKFGKNKTGRMEQEDQKRIDVTLPSLICLIQLQEAFIKLMTLVVYCNLVQHH